MTPARRRAALLLIAVMSVNASYTVLIPFVPELQHRAGADPTVIALTFALFAAAKTLSQPLGGLWVDRWRPGHVAFVAQLIAAAGIVITAVARDPQTLLAGRVCWGLGEGLVTPALYAGMGLLCRRYGLSSSRLIGNFGTAAMAGFLIGPLVTGVAAPLGLEALFFAGAAVTAVTAFGLFQAIPRSGEEGPEEAEADDAPAADGAGAGSAGPWWLWVLALGALDLFANVIYSAFEPMLPLYLSAGRDGSVRGTISVVFSVGLATFALFTWALGRYTERLRLMTLIRAGMTLMALGLAGLTLSAEVVPVAASFVLCMAGAAVLYLTARRGLIELRSAMSRQGKAFGLFGFIGDSGNVIGPIIGVALFGWTGATSFLLLGVLCVVALVGLAAVSGRFRGPRAAEPTATAGTAETTGTTPTPESTEAAVAAQETSQRPS